MTEKKEDLSSGALEQQEESGEPVKSATQKFISSLDMEERCLDFVQSIPLMQEVSRLMGEMDRGATRQDGPLMRRQAKKPLACEE
jgi:hypothetical protein